MTYTKEEIMQYMEEEDVKFIRLMFRDAFGTQKNISVMPTELKKAFEGGIGINARRIPGFEKSETAELYLVPDPETITVLPWRPESGRVVRMYCDVCGPDRTPQKNDTRVMLKKAIEHAKEEGIKFELLTNPVEILTDDDNNVKGMKCVRMELGEPDASGRRSPVPAPLRR